MVWVVWVVLATITATAAPPAASTGSPGAESTSGTPALRMCAEGTDSPAVIASCTEVLATNTPDPMRAEALRARAAALTATGQFQDARADYDAAEAIAGQRCATRLDRAAAMLEHRRELDEAARLYGTAIEICAPDDARPYVGRARVNVARRSFDAALADADRALALEPGSPDALLTRSVVHAAMGRRALAIADATALLDAPPDYALAARTNRAVWLSETEEYAASIADYDVVIAAAPGAPLLLRRGKAHALLGDCSRAVRDYATATELAPSDANTLNDAAWFLATFPDPACRNGARAVQHATAAVALAPATANFYDTLAAAHARAGDFVRAGTAIRAACDRARDPAECHGYRQRGALYSSGRAYSDARY